MRWRRGKVWKNVRKEEERAKMNTKVRGDVEKQMFFHVTAIKP